MINNIEQAIRNYLPDIIHMSLATCAENKPWVSEVHFVYDDNLNIYFRSIPSRRHSLEIAKNPNVAGNIVTQHQNSDKPRGVYFEGTAELLENVSIDDLPYKLVSERFGLNEEIITEANKEDGHKFYKITVSNFALFDSRESSPSTKYQLPWK